MPSVSLNLRRPRIGYARLVIARNSVSALAYPGINSVITLGHSPKTATNPSLSELSDGLEPHGHIEHRWLGTRDVHVRWGREGGTRGGAEGGYMGGCYTGYPPEAIFEAYLMNY